MAVILISARRIQKLFMCPQVNPQMVGNDLTSLDNAIEFRDCNSFTWGFNFDQAAATKKGGV
jgi:hypothetical protein